MNANLLIVIKKNTETSKVKNVLTKNKKSVGMTLAKVKEQGFKKERNKALKSKETRWKNASMTPK